MTLLNNKGIVEMLALIKSGKVAVVRDEMGNVISLNVNRPELKVGEVKYTKRTGMGLAVGSTLEDLEADEKAMRAFAEEWAGVDVQHLTVVAERLNKPTLDEEDIAYLNNELQRYVAKHREVVTREVTREVPVRGTANTRYPNLVENLEVLDIATLKEMKRQATRNGASDLKNACRTALRHKGVNC